MATAAIEGDSEQSSEKDGDKGDSAKNRYSYANRLKSNINYSQRLQRNVLEITLERVDKNVDIQIDDSEIERVLRTLKIDSQSGRRLPVTV